MNISDTLDGATRIVAIIGDPIAQVKSPAGITQGFASRGHDAIMIPLQVKPADIEAFFRLAKKLPNLDGIEATRQLRGTVRMPAGAASPGSGRAAARRRQCPCS